MKRAFSRKNLWEATPRLIQAVIGTVLATVPLTWLLGRRFRERYHFLQEAQWWDAERIYDYQFTALKKILTLAYEKTAYYRESFDQVGFKPGDFKHMSDLARLPTIDKTVVREHLNEMLTMPVASPNVDYMSTSGTGGTPLAFYIDSERSAAEYAYLVASWGRAGYRPGMAMAVFRGRIVQPRRDGLRYEYDPIFRHHYYSNFHMTDENMGRYLEHISTIGPCFLHVYPSSVAALARALRGSGLPSHDNIRGIIAESETVYPEQRRMVEGVFGCRYFSCYGHTEKLVLAVECEHSADYHVWPTYGYFELLDDEGRSVRTPGQCGEVVGTGFINTVMPFIRYRTGDFATYVGDRCEACGRQHAIIRDIRGHRTQEVLIAADGSEISWTALNMHDDTFMHVRQFQFYQDTPGRILLRVVPAEGFCDADRQRIVRNLRRKLDHRLEVTIEPTDSIPLSPRGKAIYVDQRIPLTAIQPT